MMMGKLFGLSGKIEKFAQKKKKGYLCQLLFSPSPIIFFNTDTLAQNGLGIIDSELKSSLFIFTSVKLIFKP